MIYVVGGLGFEFRVFVAGWRHALRSEWPFIIIIITLIYMEYGGMLCKSDKPAIILILILILIILIITLISHKN